MLDRADTGKVSIEGKVLADGPAYQGMLDVPDFRLMDVCGAFQGRPILLTPDDDFNWDEA